MLISNSATIIRENQYFIYLIINALCVLENICCIYLHILLHN